jgi:hypothetical protein
MSDAVRVDDFVMSEIGAMAKMLRTNGKTAGFDDLAVLAKVVKAVRDGDRLPRWGWPLPGSYNGATGSERVLGWQYLSVAQRRGWVDYPSSCSLCASTQRLHMHTENYFRPLIVAPVCQRCHFCLHRRFRHAASWHKLLAAVPITWAHKLSMQELTRDEAQYLAILPRPDKVVAAHA